MVHQLLYRRFAMGKLAPWQRMVGCRTEALQQLRLGHPHRFGNPGPLRHEAGNYWNGMPVRFRKQRGLPSVEPLGDGRQFMLECDTWLERR